MPLFPHVFVDWNVIFLTFVAACDECPVRGRQGFLSMEHLLVVSAGAISRDSIQLLTADTDFVALSCFTGCVVLIRALFLVDVEAGRPVSGQ